MLSERSQMEKDKYSVMSLKCGIYKVKQNSDHNKKRSRLTDIQNKLLFTSGEKREGTEGAREREVQLLDVM